MRRDARSGKQNGKPKFPIQRIPQRGESRGLIGIVVHRLVTAEARVSRKPDRSLPGIAEFGSAAGCLREGASMQVRSCASIPLKTARLRLVCNLVPG